MDKKLLDRLVCPQCRHTLDYQGSATQLLCLVCQLAFPIEDNIPIMLLDQAKPLSSSE